ncbi:MAG: HDIG domain-containing protein [Acidobacteria bacterium]|nr:HDIG domain-containing protein [Acidobacteriota bacterium]
MADRPELRVSRWPAGRLPARVAVAALVALALGILVSPGLSRRVPHYAAGDYATRSIRAPYDFSVVDVSATERRRRDAAAAAPVVAALDSGAAAKAASRLVGAFEPMARLFEEADAQRVPSENEVRGLSSRARAALEKRRAVEADAWLAGALAKALPAFEAATGIRLADDERGALERERYSGRVVRLLASVLEAVHAEPIVADRAAFEPLPGAGGGPRPRPVVLRDQAGGERPASQLRTRDEAAALVPARVDAMLPAEPPDLRRAIARIAAAAVVPNASHDAAASAARREAAEAAVLPVSLAFRRNQLIVGEGLEVTPQIRLALDELRARHAPAVFGSQVAGSSLLFFLLVIAGLLVRGDPSRQAAGRPRGGADARDAVFLAGGLVLAASLLRLWLVTVDLLLAGNPALSPMALALLFPLAGVPMLTRFVLDERSAAAQLLVWSVAAGLMADHGVEVASLTLVSGLVGMWAVARCSSRACLVRAGLRAGGAAGAAALAAALVAQLGPPATATATLLGGAGGFLSGLLVIALAPAIEWLFGYTTRINLLEMISYEHPLLKRLIAEAPGTFQHSATVGVLADAGAAAIGADRLLVRVGALYHDIGKIENGALFIENQRGPNPHDSLPPAESARIVRRHVTDGVKLVERYGLGDQVAAFVREHHGTRRIVYFLERAKAAGLTVDEADYTYPGPRPASRETAVLMVADQAEAVGRLKPGRDVDEYRATIAAAVEQLRADGQFDEAPITTADLRRMRDAMAEVLARMHHRRIPYPGQEGGPPLADGGAGQPAASSAGGPAAS